MASPSSRGDPGGGLFSVGELDDNGGVVAGSLALALLPVDERPGRPGGKGGGAQHQVDPHALATGEAQLRQPPTTDSFSAPRRPARASSTESGDHGSPA